jgi:hypothetical protein
MDAYRASGILPMSLSPQGQVMVLLMQEQRKDGLWYIDIGGKIEPQDQRNPWKTALREFKEETVIFVPSSDSILRTMYHEKNKYVSFLIYYQWFGPKKSWLYRWVSLESLWNGTANLRLHRRLKDILYAMKR